jgi:hypothetical protein
MQLVVAVKDPYGLKGAGDPQRPPLVVGTFVDVTIKGKTLKEVFVIPRKAIRDNGSVWIMDAQGKLQIKTVKPVRIEREKVILTEGLDAGDLIVLNNISGAADGMKLRLLNQ